MKSEHKKGMIYNVLPGTKLGVVTADYLEKIAKVARVSKFLQIACKKA
jgi:hypothetical protein